MLSVVHFLAVFTFSRVEELQEDFKKYHKKEVEYGLIFFFYVLSTFGSSLSSHSFFSPVIFIFIALILFALNPQSICPQPSPPRDWPGLCLFRCFQPLVLLRELTDFGLFFYFITIIRFTHPPPPQSVCRAWAKHDGLHFFCKQCLVAFKDRSEFEAHKLSPEHSVGGGTSCHMGGTLCDVFFVFGKKSPRITPPLLLHLFLGGDETVLRLSTRT